MADVEKPDESKTESEATGAAGTARKSSVRKKAAVRKKVPVRKKSVPKRKAVAKKVAAKKAVSNAEPAATAAAAEGAGGGKSGTNEPKTPPPPAVEQPPIPAPPPTAGSTAPAPPPPRPAGGQPAAPKPAPTPPPAADKPSGRGSRRALALWIPMLVVGVLIFTLADRNPVQEADPATGQPAGVAEAPPSPSTVAGAQDGASGAAVVEEAAPSTQAPAEPVGTMPMAAEDTTEAAEVIVAPVAAEIEPVVAAEPAVQTEPAAVTDTPGESPVGDEAAPASAEVVSETEAAVPGGLVPAPTEPGMVTGPDGSRPASLTESTAVASPGVGIAPETPVTAVVEPVPSPTAMPEPPQPAALGEAASTVPTFTGPYPSMPPAPRSVSGSAPTPPVPPTHPEPPGYAAPIGAPPGYYRQRQFEPQAPPGYSSPLPLPGPGSFDPFGPDDGLREPPPPLTAEDVWPERQVSPSTRRYQPYYAPPVPGHPAPYTFSPGRGPYGSYPYPR